MLAEIAVVVSILTFFLGYVITETIKRREQRAVRKKYLLALSTEIELNTEWLERSIRNMPSTPEFREFLEKGPKDARSGAALSVATICFRPHLINNYLDNIFKQHANILADMPDHLIRSIIKFYDKLDWIDLTVDSIEKQSFASISISGREGIMESLRIGLHEALAHGTEVRGTIRLLLEPTRIV